MLKWPTRSYSNNDVNDDFRDCERKQRSKNVYFDQDDLHSIISSQSVPDLDEALRLVRGEDEALDAR